MKDDNARVSLLNEGQGCAIIIKAVQGSDIIYSTGLL